MIRCLAFITTLMLLAALTCLPARAQERLEADEWKQGYHGFTLLCRSVGLEPTEDMQRWGSVPADQSVLVMFGRLDRPPLSLEAYLRAGGAVLLASDRNDRGALLRFGIGMVPGPLSAARHEDALAGYLDCPIVSVFDPEHPVTQGLQTICTNRPGMLRIPTSSRRFPGSPGRWQTLANLPILEPPFSSPGSRGAGPPLIAAGQWEQGGRALAIADQSIFANQMLPRGDNARLAMNLLLWLREGGRTTVLILNDREAIVPSDPRQVDVDIPPPTPEQVREALRHLPPEMLLEFANEVARTLEDGGILNDFLTFLQQSLSPRAVYRALIGATTGLLAFFALAGLFSRLAASDIMRRRSGTDGHERARLERQRAARELLTRWRADLNQGRAIPWPAFAKGFRFPGRPLKTYRLRRKLVIMSGQLAASRRRYWSRRRLQRLDAELRRWRQLHESGNLSYQQRGGTEQA